MILKRIKVNTGLIGETNCYIIQDQETMESIVIDPGGEADKIIDMLNILQAKVKYIYLTHCHCDHIGAVEKVKQEKGGKILIHRFDAEGLYDPSISLTDQVGLNVPELEIASRVDDNDIIHIGNIEFKVIHTPGHTKGSSSLYCETENMLFSGDTIFKGTWGRTDLPTSNFEDIINSITNKILVLPDDTIIYPGHGRMTRVKDEKNIYLELKEAQDV